MRAVGAILSYRSSFANRCMRLEISQNGHDRVWRSFPAASLPLLRDDLTVFLLYACRVLGQYFINEVS